MHSWWAGARRNPVAGWTTLVALCVVLAAGAAQAATPQYKIELIDNHGGLHPQTAEAISKRGEIAGSADVASNLRTVGYRYRHGRLSMLIDSDRALIQGINKAGDVVGIVYPNSYIWHADGTREALPDSWLGGINGAGQVAGSIFDTDEAIVYDHGAIVRLGKLSGGAQSRATGINDAGQVAGTSYLDGYAAEHAFVWKDGLMTDLGTLGGKHSWATGINALGHVAGLSETAAGDFVAFIHDSVSMRALPKTAGGAGLITASEPNIHDEVVGASGAGPLLAARNGKTYVLKDLLDASGAEWEELLSANGINDAGQVVGIGMRNGYQRAYVATPVPR
jgi:probable HAF family extracellular repeat protein